MANGWENIGNSERLYFFLAPIPLQMVTATSKLKDICSLGKSYEQTRGRVKNQRHYFADKGPSDQSYGFPSNNV